MLSDIEIAQNTHLKSIREVAYNLGIEDDDIELYGKYKAKINDSLYQKLSNKRNGKLILVTAINPTPAGEGKTTVTIGIGQAMKKIGKSAVTVLREPSLGPVFGMKGGAAGGGYSQALPMEDINLHFTGDIHAITAANNLLCAALDNHIHYGNKLRIDVRRILIRRCMDVNDRSLRRVIIGVGGENGGVPREDSFAITAASEVMAILCLSSDLSDLKQRLGNILIAFDETGDPVYAKDLNVHGAMTVLLKEAINPNLVQSVEGTPIIMHGGPFANIAHGCNSLRATRISMKLADYCITEAGFGSDLGAEKFFDIKCRVGGLSPSAVVIVVTSRALKYNGGCPLKDINKENISCLKSGICNLGVHIRNMKKFNIPIIVGINKFSSDTEDELKFIENFCTESGVESAISDTFENGGKGGMDLARKICGLASKKSELVYMYNDKMSIKQKIQTISKEIYGARGVEFSNNAERSIKRIESIGRDDLPICVAKTQYSLSDDMNKLGAPSDFTVNVRDASLSNGAGFVVVYMGNIMVMPGLPRIPSAELINIDQSGKIRGLF